MPGRALSRAILGAQPQSRVHTQGRNERFLRNIDGAKFGAYASFRPFVSQQLPLSGCVTPVAFCRHVLPQRSNRFSGYDLTPIAAWIGI